MRMELFTPVRAGQNATVRVYGNYELGYIKVKLSSKYVTALPDAHPGVPSDRRMVMGPPSGQGYDVWSDPPWKAGDSVDFELYDIATNTLQTTCSTVVIP